MVEISQSALIYDRLRLAILRLDVAPGQRLVERALETEFAASRTPVRAALLRLETEGLVRREGRGWISAPIDLNEIEALGEYREAIESAAIRLACDRASDEDLAATDELLRSQLLDDHATGSDPSTIDFHIELARLAGNAFFTAAMRDILTRLSRTRWLELRTGETRELAHGEHTTILRHLVARDADAATAAAIAHIRNTNSRLQESLASDRMRFSASGLSIIGATGPNRSL
jgi:DNA-binding GntR family transcriptional regulator